MGLSELYLTSSSGRPPLRIGVLLDDTSLPQCFYEVLEDIRASNFASLQLIVLRQDPSSIVHLPHASLAVRAWRILRNPQRRRTLFYWWYSQSDAKRNPIEP